MPVFFVNVVQVSLQHGDPNIIEVAVRGGDHQVPRLQLKLLYVVFQVLEIFGLGGRDLPILEHCLAQLVWPVEVLLRLFRFVFEFVAPVPEFEKHGHRVPYRGSLEGPPMDVVESQGGGAGTLEGGPELVQEDPQEIHPQLQRIVYESQ